MKALNLTIGLAAVLAVLIATSSDAHAQGAPLTLDIVEVNVGEGGPAPQVGPFIEIQNTSGQVNQPLDNYRLATPDQSTTIELTDGVTLGIDEFWVVCGDAGLPVPNCDQMSPDLDTILAEDVVTLEYDLNGTWLTEDSVDFSAVTADPVDRSGVTTTVAPPGTTVTWVLQCPSPGEPNPRNLELCGVLVNEIDYDQGDVNNARFVELAIYDDRNLTCAQIRFADPEGTETVFLLPEGIGTVEAGSYFVVCDDKDLTPNCDREFSETELGCGTSDAQDFTDVGEHGVAFAFGGRITPIDSMSYNGPVDGYTEGDAEAPSDLASPGAISVSRVPDFGDSDQNASDFAVVCATPGEANAEDLSSCGLCGTNVVEDGTDEECDEGGDENTATCEVDCTLPACGDGIYNALAEDCDPSDSSSPPCNDDCTLETAFARGSGGCNAGSGASGLGLGLLLLAGGLLALRRRRVL